MSKGIYECRASGVPVRKGLNLLAISLTQAARPDASVRIEKVELLIRASPLNPPDDPIAWGQKKGGRAPSTQ